jgi:hypothetical protein
MRVAERPSLLPLIDTTLSNVIDWANTPYWYTGFAPGQVVPSAPHNTLWLLGALWNGYLDYGTVRTDDYLQSAADQRWSTTQLAYAVGDEVITLGAEVDTYVTYYVGGYRIEVDAGLLRPYGALPLLQPGATLPGRLWIYLDYGVITDPAQPVAAIRVESVAAGVPASPAVGELPLVGVDLNALGVVTGNTYDASDPELGLVYSSALPQAFLGNVVIGGSLEAGSLELGGALDMGGFAITNADDVGCESVTANNGISAGTLTTSGDVEIGGDLDMTLGAISNATTIGATAIACTSVAASANVGGVTLSSSGLSTLNQLEVTTTSAFTGIINPLAGVNLGAQQIAGTAGSIVDVDRVLPDKIEFTNMGAVYSTTAGHLRYNETALMFAQSATLGDAVAIDDPQRGFDLAFSTVNAIDTTTAQASRTVQQAEPVWIEISARYEGTSVGNLNLRVSVSGTPGTVDIGTTSFRIDAINVGWSLHHVMLWTPTDNFITPGTLPYSFTVRLGVSAGTLTCANVAIKVSSAIEI